MLKILFFFLLYRLLLFDHRFQYHHRTTAAGRFRHEWCADVTATKIRSSIDSGGLRKGIEKRLKGK
jgi:hypothetical protein